MNTPPKTITSTANPTVKSLKALAQRKHREESGLFLVEGARDIAGAVAAGWAPDILAYDPARPPTDAVIAAAREVLHVTPDILSRIMGRDNAQGAIAAFPLPATPLTAVQGGLWVVLEGVRDPGNLGTIIRTADAVGADGVILIGACCDPYQPETIRATMGSFARIPVIRAPYDEFIAWRRRWPGAVIGTHLHARAVDYRMADYNAPLLLLMGGESDGLSEDMAAACDTLVKIPMAGGTESLNLAVSTGIMLYEIRRGVL